MEGKSGKPILEKWVRAAFAFVLASALCLPVAPAFGAGSGQGESGDAPVLTLDGGDASGDAGPRALSPDVPSSFSPARNTINGAQVCLGEDHSAFIKTDGTLWMWGRNSDGQLGDGTTTDRHEPVKVMSGVAQVVPAGISNNNFFRSSSAALKTDGTLWMWGDNEFGQLGDGTTTDRHEPVKVMSGVAQVAIDRTSEYSAAIKTDGTL